MRIAPHLYKSGGKGFKKSNSQDLVQICQGDGCESIGVGEGDGEEDVVYQVGSCFLG